MAPLNKAILYIDADVDGDGVKESGEFHMKGGVSYNPTIRTGYLVDNRGSSTNSVLSSTVGDGENKRKGFFLDLGGGVKAVEVTFESWEGSQFQWGNDGNGGTKADATGEDPMTQLEVLMKYLEVAEVDSRNPAVLEYGEHHTNGRYGPMEAVMESPQGTRSAEDGSWFSGTITFLSVQGLNETVDGEGLTG